MHIPANAGRPSQGHQDLFSIRFPDEKSCSTYLNRVAGRSVPQCHRCGARKLWRTSRGTTLCANSNCKYEFSPVAETIFAETRLSLLVWFRAIWWILSEEGPASARKMQTALGLGSYRTSWKMLQKVRELMAQAESRRLKHEGEFVIHTLDSHRPRPVKLLIGIELGSTKSDKQERVRRIRIKVTHAKGDRDWSSIVSRDFHERYINQSLRRSRHIEKQVTAFLSSAGQTRIDVKYLQSYLDEFVFRVNNTNTRDIERIFRKLIKHSAL